VEDEVRLQDAASTLESLGHAVLNGTAEEAEQRKVKAFIGFRDPAENHIELVVQPERSGRRYFASRDAGITVNVTSHAVKAPVAMLALSNGARTGLTGFVAGLARSVVESTM
jgi:hypothetical protein